MTEEEDWEEVERVGREGVEYFPAELMLLELISISSA